MFQSEGTFERHKGPGHIQKIIQELKVLYVSSIPRA